MPTTPPRLWRMHELAFTAQADYADPIEGVRVDVAFIGPGGARLTIPAFWDGQRDWKARFMPTAAGRWEYRTRCDHAADAGLHDRAGVIDVGQAEGEHGIHRHGGILRVADNRRHLTHTDGTPFFWLGDTWWFCPSDLMPIERSNRPGVASMYKSLIDTRAKQGYTTLHMAFLGASGVDGSYTDVFHGRINPAYWRRADAYIDYANAAGIVPVIGMGFHHGLDQPTLPQLKRLWRYVLARYGAHAVTFLFCGEYNLRMYPKDADAAKLAQRKATDEDRVSKMLQVGALVKEIDPYRRALTIHPWWHGGDRRDAWSQPWYDFILLQGGHGAEGPPLKVYADAWSSKPTRPVLEGECNYEMIQGFSDAVVRRSAYRAIQAGSFGFTYGAHGLWYPTQDERDEKFKEWGKPLPWWEAIALPGGAQMRHLRDCYERVDWWTLMPLDEGGHLAFDSAGDAKPRQVLVKADEGSTALLYYVAASAPQTLAPNRLHFGVPDARYTATWFNPRNGVVTTLADAMLRRDTGIALPPPPDQEDWMLILRRA